MRDKINRLARGKYEYDTSKVLVVPEQIEGTMEEGTCYEGTFIISNELHQKMKGVVTSDCVEITFSDTGFEGVENEVSFCISMQEEGKNREFQGEIQIICDKGTCTVPVRMQMRRSHCKAGNVSIDTLTEFVALAEKDFEKAATVFSQPLFYETLLYGDKQGKALYQGLYTGKNPKRELEQFLIGHCGKRPIALSVEPVFRQYDGCRESFQDEITVGMESWGYEEITITSDCDFLIPGIERMHTLQFSQGMVTVPVTIEPEKMALGKNFGRIDIATVHEKISVSVIAIKPGIGHEEAQTNRRRQRTLCQIVKRHMAFCMNRLPMQDYLQEMDQLLRNSGVEKDSLYMQLYRIHLAIMENNTQAVESGLQKWDSQVETLYETNPDAYAGYYYLKGIWSDEEDTVTYCVERIRDCYENKGKSWVALWCLLYLDKNIQSDEKKYALLLAQLQQGCYSPMIYLEVCQLFNDHPSYLSELTEEVAQAVHLGCKNQFLEREAALRYVYLAGRMRRYSQGILEDMMLLYEQYPEDEILTVICKMLIQGQNTGKKAFFWYAKGVERNLRITELFEYYMYALDEEKEHRFNNNIMLYFLYDNHLTVEKKAMLYAYIVQNKEKDPETYQSYYAMIQNFAVERLLEGKINSNLASLYQAFLEEIVGDAALCRALAKLVLKGLVVCNDPGMVGVVVKYPQLNTEEFVPLRKGKAIVHCGGKQVQLFMADRENNLYSRKDTYTVQPFFDLDTLLVPCWEQAKDLPYLLLEMEQALEEGKAKEIEPLTVWQPILEFDTLEEGYRKRLHSKLVRYCYRQGKTALLEEEMQHLEWQQVLPKDRETFLEYMALCQCYDKAMEGILLFGWENIPGKRLATIAEDTFVKVAGVADAKMVCLAWKLFEEEVCPDAALQYLVKYYSGTINKLIKIYTEAKKRQLPTQELLERMIAQSIFAEEVCPDIFPLFMEYVPEASNQQVVEAFKKTMAYGYLLKEQTLPESMFALYAKDVQIHKNTPCLLALLKYLSSKETLTEEEICFADFHVNALWEKKMVLPFFKDFSEKFTLPSTIADQVYVSFVSNPEYDVFIHYRIYTGEEKGKFKKEKMQDRYAGMHVKEFMLFQDEVLEYFLSGPGLDKEDIHETQRITMDKPSKRICSSNRYRQLNDMMELKKKQQDIALVEKMEQFTMDREIAGAMFKPL